MNFLNAIRKKARIGKDDSFLSSNPALALPPTPSPAISSQFLPIPSSPQPQLTKKSRRKNHPKSPEPPPLPSKEAEFTLDTNLDEMEGIVDLTIRNDFRALVAGDQSSPGSGFESSNQSGSLSASDVSYPLTSSPPNPFNLPVRTLFNDPFPSNSSASLGRRKIGPPPLDVRKITPEVTLPPSEHRDYGQHSPGWVAPESWAVEKEGEVPEVPDYTSSDDDGMNGREKTKHPRRRTRNPKRSQSTPTYQIRIHRSDGSYHVVRCPLTITVAELIPVMNKRLVLDLTRESHSLYVKERERG